MQPLQPLTPVQSSRSAGQIVLITLLVLAVGTTVALSLIGRTTIDTAISANLEESARAFGAAEAGIESALGSGLGTGGAQVLTGGTTYETTVSTVGGSEGVVRLSKKTLKGTTETVWFVDHNEDGTLNETITFLGENLDICWSYESPVEPAVVFSILYKEGSDGSYKVVRDAFDPVPARASSNKFQQVPSPPSGGCGISGFYGKNISFASYGVNPNNDILLALRLRPVYSDTEFAFNPNNFVIPLQGTKIESVGKTATGVTRKVIVHKQYTSAASVFDAAVYSQGSFGH